MRLAIIEKIYWLQFWTSKIIKHKKHICLKLANYLIVTLQERVIKPSHVIGYPYHLIIDTGDICNLGCALCPTGQRRDGRTVAFVRGTE